MEEPRERKRRKRRRSPLRGLLLILLVLVLMGGSAFLGTRLMISSRPVRLTFENIGELATQAAYFTNVQDISKTRTVLGLNVPFTTSKYIFSYDGVIKAGMDFADIDVHEDPLSHTVKVTLPEVRVLSIDIDTDSLKIYDERRNIYSPLNLDNVNDSLAEMKREAEQNAIANGLFNGARTNAEVLLRGFLASAYDPEQWRIEFIEPASTKDKESRDEA